MANEEDVQAAPSTAAAEPEPEPAPEPTPDSGEVAGRTLDNLRAEFDRKFRQQQSTLEQLLAVMSSQTRPEPTPQRGWDQYDDAQLAQLAQSGSTDAHVALTQRIAAREADQRSHAQRQVDSVRAQLGGLYAKYPMLADVNHPLTQAAMRAKLVLQQSGEPATQATDVKAIMIAIADNPQLAVTSQAPTPRRVDPGPQITTDGHTPRRSPSAKPATKIDPKVAEVARRYGVDPEKALANMRQRIASKQSGVSPQVAIIVREQGGEL